MSLVRREEQELHGHHERSVGEHSSARNRTGVLASPLVKSNRVLLRKAITLPSFSGLTRDWVNWNYAVERYFEVHNLRHVLLVGYLQSPHFHFEDNKLVYFTLEMVLRSPRRLRLCIAEHLGLMAMLGTCTCMMATLYRVSLPPLSFCKD
jgi:hypothetical protein